MNVELCVSASFPHTLQLTSLTFTQCGLNNYYMFLCIFFGRKNLHSSDQNPPHDHTDIENLDLTTAAVIIKTVLMLSLGFTPTDHLIHTLCTTVE